MIDQMLGPYRVLSKVGAGGLAFAHSKTACELRRSHAGAKARTR